MTIWKADKSHDLEYPDRNLPPRGNPMSKEAFLEELTALTHKYGIQIAGCGCCDSPYLIAQQLPGRYEVRGEYVGYTVEPEVRWARQVQDRLTYVDIPVYLRSLNNVAMSERKTPEELSEGIRLTKVFVAQKTHGTYDPCPST